MSLRAWRPNRGDRLGYLTASRSPRSPSSQPSAINPKDSQNERRRPRAQVTGFSTVLYRYQNAVERMFGRLKDFRRIGKRYDRRADVFLAALCYAATVSFWLRA